MLQWLQRARFKRLMIARVAVLALPTPIKLISREYREEIDVLVDTALQRKWTPEMAAAVEMTWIMCDIIKTQASVGDRQRSLEQLQARTSEDPLVSELGFEQRLMRRDPEVMAMTGLAVRIALISGKLASWLLRQRTIDLYTKSLFAEGVARALADLPSDEIKQFLIERQRLIGTDPAGFANAN